MQYSNASMAILNTTPKGILEKMQRDLAELVRERDTLNARIIEHQAQIRSLSSAILRTEITQRRIDHQQALLSLTDAIRTVLRLQRRPMTAADVKGAMDMLGYNFQGMNNPSSVIHNTLKRLAGTGELKYDGATKTYTLNPVWHQLFELK